MSFPAVSPNTTTPRLFYFSGTPTGVWRATRQTVVVGEPLPAASCVSVTTSAPSPTDTLWTLRGIISNERYVTRDEKTALVAKQEGLGRPASLCAALIPMKKSPAWWSLTQDERRRIFEEQSGHVQTGLRFLPAIARRLHHCRDLGPDEPFDFITWFEYAPAETAAFDDLLQQLRASPEWRYVTREIDLRLERTA
jgi:chlorite dismutase